MAPTEHIVEWQTQQIIRYLFEDEADAQNRCALDAGIEHDGPGDNDDNFDPVLIADQLKRVGDALSDDASFMAAVKDLKKAVVQEATDVAFSAGVEALCQNQVAQRAEVAPEMQLIQASVAFGLYITKSSPELKSKVQNAMNSFLNKRVKKWVTEQGGWDKVNVAN